MQVSGLLYGQINKIHYNCIMKKFIIIILFAFLCIGTYTAYAAKAPKQTETVTYTVNMHCQNCVNKLTDNLSFLKGVEDFKISLNKKTITIKFDPEKIQEKEFVDTIEKLGYTADKQEPKKKK